MGRTLALVACLIGAVLLAWLGLRTPRALGVDAPAAAFAAGRAMTDVAIIAQEPHPVGSIANAKVREHLRARLRQLGLEERVQSAEIAGLTTVGDTALVAGGKVENVIGVLPGRDRSLPAVALMAHYDSVPASPGAADDAAGVAAMLEIARALQAGEQPLRDVALIFTDGEEAGLLGARAFFSRDLLAGRIGFLVNLEARGGGGRANMFQTGPQNGPTIALFGRAAVQPFASSLTAFVYERMPNDTDFTISRQADIPGLNFAFIGRQFDYHSPTSTPENLDKGALQDIGRQALAATRHAADAETLPKKGAEAVYAAVAGNWLLSYPPLTGWLVVIAAAALMGVGLVRGRLVAKYGLLDLAQGALAFLYVLTGAAALLRLARRATGVGFGFLEQRPLLAQTHLFEAALVLIGLGLSLYAGAALAKGKMRVPTIAMSLGAGLLCSLFGGWDLVGLGLGATGAVLAAICFGRPARLPGGWGGVLIAGLITAIAAQILAPAAAFIIAWPMLFAGLSAALVANAAVRDPVDTVIAAVVAAIGLGWLGPYVHLAYQALDMPELLAAFAALAALFLWPLAHPRIGGAGRYTAAGVIVVGFLLVGAVRFLDPWSERRPEASGVLYVLDQPSQTAWLASFTPTLPHWSREALGEDAKLEQRSVAPLFRRPLTAAAAPWAQALRPSLAMSSTLEGARLVQAIPPPGARFLALDLTSSADLSDVLVDGQPVTLEPSAAKRLRIRWHGDPDGLAISFHADEPGTLTVRYAAVIEGWPAGAPPLPPRPPEVMAFDISDSTVVTGAQRLTW